MRLKLVYKKNRTVAAIMSGDSSVLDALSTIAPNMQKAALGMDALFRRFAEGGRTSCPAVLFHEIDKAEGIWEFIKGRVRVLCFICPHDGSLLVLTHQFVKSTQKTPKSEISAAVSLKNAYLEARSVGMITIVEE